ncbi:MAG TPA: IPT/TIG domain-containing protein [Thermoanaerobaculia bacterium]|nr:IPT/TIG domain-containing protein [Thermoanaerobaculia bacterium]HUM31310.1 IPT/TIG domain-containing protein [Thermoanaerobaculia bacterium]HXK69664.1 IPT/TIG domain-containing protein [Thermoanaerobaculia bacterium]
MKKLIVVSLFFLVCMVGTVHLEATGLGLRDTPVVMVQVPNGGEFWDYSPDPAVRRSHMISWSAINDAGPVTRVRISYSANGGTTWTCVADSDGTTCPDQNVSGSDLLLPDDTSFVWEMPTWGEAAAEGQTFPSASGRILVEAWDDMFNMGQDISDANFYMIQPTTSSIETIILWNSQRIESVYGASDQQALEFKLEELAAHTYVEGEIIDLSLVPAIQDAYACWDKCYDGNGCTDLTDCSVASFDPQVRANALADLIQDRITSLVTATFPNARSLILVGDDVQIPFYRIGEGVLLKSEESYPAEVTMDTAHTVGSALEDDYYLTDNYYAELNPEPTGLPAPHDLIYIPDLYVGRLVETPTQMMDVINIFFAVDGEVNLTNGWIPQLVTGFGPSFDTGFAIRTEFTADGRPIDCRLDNPLGSGTMIPCIDQPYSPADLEASLFQVEPYPLSMIGNGANHYSLEASEPFDSTDTLYCTDPSYDISGCYPSGIEGNALDLSGTLLFSLGDHNGLPVPASDGRSLDLTEELAKKGVLGFIASTSYTWVAEEGKGYTEKIMEELIGQLLDHTEMPLGKALAYAKRRAFQKTRDDDCFSLKAMHSLTLFGIPNTVVLSVPPLRDGKSVSTQPVVSKTLSDHQGNYDIPPGIVEMTLNLDIASDAYDLVHQGTGDYYTMNGVSSVKAGQNIQPIFSYDTNLSGFEAQGIVFTGGVVESRGEMNVVLAAPHCAMSGTIPGATDPDLPSLLPVLKKSHATDSSIWGRVGDHNLFTTLNVETGYLDQGTEYTFSSYSVAIYYSNTTDSDPPVLADPGAGGYHTVNGLGADFVVRVNDDEGVFRVLVVWFDPSTLTWSSEDLTYNSVGGQWSGTIEFRTNVRYFIEAVDTSGNSVIDTVRDDLPYLGTEDYCVTNGCTFLAPRLFEVQLVDLDNDTMPDAWEDLYECVHTGIDDRNEDTDGDLLTHREEYLADSDPCDPDTDGGLDNDGSEVRHGRNPLDPADDLSLALDLSRSAVEGTLDLCWPDVMESNGEIDGPYYLYRATAADFSDAAVIFGPLSEGTTCQPDTPPCETCFYKVFNLEIPTGPEPQVDAVVPGIGSVAGGEGVSVYGLNFQDGAEVMFCDAPATGVVWKSESKVNCVTPVHTAGPCDVTVINPDKLSDTMTAGFLYQ